MKREICCPECAGKWRDTLGMQRPGDIGESGALRAKPGIARGNYMCDGCGVEIMQGTAAVAVSLSTESTPYFEWESDYIDPEGATNAKFSK